MDSNELEKIKYQFGKELEAQLKDAFAEYDLYFKWAAGWDVNEDPIFISDIDGSVTVYMEGDNSEFMAEIKKSDYEVLGRFIKDIANQFIKAAANRSPYNMVSLELGSIIVSPEGLSFPRLGVLVEVYFKED